MKDYISHLDAILSSAGEQLLDGPGKVSHQQAMDKAQAKYRKCHAKTLTELEKHYLGAIKMLGKQTKKTEDENK